MIFPKIQYAEANNLEYDLFEEVESTRKTRPIKQELLTQLRNGEYKAVVVFKLDRYARSSRELILEVQELTNKGIGFIFHFSGNNSNYIFKLCFN